MKSRRATEVVGTLAMIALVILTATEIVGMLAMIALALLWLCGLLGLPLPLGQ